MADTTDPRIAEIRARFAERDELYVECSQRIQELLDPSVVPALYELLEVQKHNVTFIEVGLVDDDMVVVVLAVSYDQGATLPKFVQRVAPVAQERPQIFRLLRVSVPLDICVAPKDEIVAFLKEKAQFTDEMEEQKPSPPPVPFNSFDPAKLTEAQLKALVLSRQMMTPTKH